MNNHKRKFFILGTLFGVFLTAFAILIFISLPSITQNSSKEISFDQAILLLKNKEIKEAHFRSDQVNFTDFNNETYSSTIKSNANQELLLKEINQANENSRNPTRTIIEPQNKNLFWLAIINALPYIILGVCFFFSLYWYVNSKSKNKNLD